MLLEFGPQAFKNCYALGRSSDNSLTIEDASIAYDAFENCTSLKFVELNNIEFLERYYGSNFFIGCNNIKNVYL